jgi:guanyl-specific ribonuclease Sa
VLVLILTLLAFYFSPAVSIARDTPSLRSEASKIEDLPKEAQRTLALIKKGGPFPHLRV